MLRTRRALVQNPGAAAATSKADDSPAQLNLSCLILPQKFWAGSQVILWRRPPPYTAYTPTPSKKIFFSEVPAVTLSG